MSSYKLLNDNCKYENKVSPEELSYLKSLLRNRNIVIQKGEKGNTVVIIDKEKYIQGVKNVISGSSKFIPLNIPPEDYINYIANVEKKFRKLFNNLYVNNKINKDELLKFCPVGSRPESYTTIKRFINQVSVKCLNIDQFIMLLTLQDIIFQNS